MKLIRRMRVVPVDNNTYFLLNGLNGAIDILDQNGFDIFSKWQNVENVTPEEEEKELFQALQERGYLVQDNNAEEMIITDLFDQLEESLKSQKKIEPLLVLTYDCNFRCPYCYEQTLMDKGVNWFNKRITPEMIHTLFKHFDQYELKQITLFGGEPLLLQNMDTIEEIANYAKKRDVYINIITNAFYLEKYIPLLSGIKLHKIQITLDGNEIRHNQTRFTADKKGTFQKILENIKKAREVNLPIFLRCNVDVEEKCQVEDLLTALDKYELRNDPGIELFLAALIDADYKNQNSCHMLHKYIEQIDKAIDYPNATEEMLAKMSHIANNFLGIEEWHPKYIYCFAHSSLQVFDPWGKIYPCSVLVGREKDLIGTYDENGIVFNDNYTKWHSRTVRNIPKCRDCELPLFCGGGCAGESSYTGKDFYQPDCSNFEAYLSELLPYLYKRYVKEEK